MVEHAPLDQWYCIKHLTDVPQGTSANCLLGQDLILTRSDTVTIMAGDRFLPIRRRYGYLWTSFGNPGVDVPPIPEADEPDRRYVPCGAISVRASGLRIVESFLDMAHFPFVHTDILGSEHHAEVEHYDCEIRRDVDEVWATDCTFVQPRAALSATGAIKTEYMYRVTTSFTVILYKACPNAANRWDVSCLFVQPLDPDRCRAHPVMFMLDDTSPVPM